MLLLPPEAEWFLTRMAQLRQGVLWLMLPLLLIAVSGWSVEDEQKETELNNSLPLSRAQMLGSTSSHLAGQGLSPKLERLGNAAHFIIGPSSGITAEMLRQLSATQVRFLSHLVNDWFRSDEWLRTQKEERSEAELRTDSVLAMEWTIAHNKDKIADDIRSEFGLIL